MSRTGFTILTAALLAVDSFVHAQGQQPAPQPLAQRASDALERVTWRTRTLVGDDRLTRWKFAVPSDGVGVPTFLEAVVRADAAVVDFVEGTSTQQVSPDVQKTLDWNLAPQDIAALRGRMGTIKMLAYRVDNFPRDAAGQRKLFEFAKAMGATLLVTNAKLELTAPAKLADEFEINVAAFGPGIQEAKLVEQMKAENLSKRVGVGIDTGAWAAEGVSPREGIAGVKDRLMYLRLRDAARAAVGAMACRAWLSQAAVSADACGAVRCRVIEWPVAVTVRADSWAAG